MKKNSTVEFAMRDNASTLRGAGKYTEKDFPRGKRYTWLKKYLKRDDLLTASNRRTFNFTALRSFPLNCRIFQSFSYE